MIHMYLILEMTYRHFLEIMYQCFLGVVGNVPRFSVGYLGFHHQLRYYKSSFRIFSFFSLTFFLISYDENIMFSYDEIRIPFQI